MDQLFGLRHRGGDRFVVSLGDLRAPPMLCRPYGAYIYWGILSPTGVNTPAYVLAPYGLIMSLRISTPTRFGGYVIRRR